MGEIGGGFEEQGHKLPLLDAIIAATALERGQTLVTRNTRDFQKAREKTVNPSNKH